MNKLLLGILMLILILMPTWLFGGSDKEDALFEKAGEMTYEGQLKKARSMLEDKDSETPLPVSSDDSWTGTSLLLGIIWGSIGTGYFIYGKKQAKALFLIGGIGLVLLPMFVSSILANTILGLILVVAPLKIDI